MKVVSKEISKLFTDPANVRTHSAKNLDTIKSSLKKFGQQKPIVINENDIVIAGNGTLIAAKELGWNEIDCVVTKLDGTNQVGFAIADNRTTDLSNWDTESLGDVLKNLNDDNWNLSELGFDIDDLKELKIDFDTSGFDNNNENDCDKIPEIEKNVYGVKRGQIWQLGNHRLMCGDSTNESNYLELLGSERAVFSFTSPPYVDQRDYNGEIELDTKHLSTFLKAPCDLFAVNLGMKRKDNEIVQYWSQYIAAAKEYGHKFLSWNVWDKDLAGSISNQKAMFSITHEWIFVFGKKKELNRIFQNDIEGNNKRRRYDPINIKGKAQRLVRQKDGSTKFSNRGDSFDCKQMSTVLVSTPVMARNIDHPAMFPVELAEIYILSCCNKKDIVYEPFLGSGSTLIACEKTGRKCYGIEIDPHYCSVIIQRWQDYTGEKAELIDG